MVDFVAGLFTLREIPLLRSRTTGANSSYSIPISCKSDVVTFVLSESISPHEWYQCSNQYWACSNPPLTPYHNDTHLINKMYQLKLYIWTNIFKYLNQIIVYYLKKYKWLEKLIQISVNIFGIMWVNFLRNEED